jgi:hypothetical protein
MYTCKIQVFLPLCCDGTNSPTCFTIASFDFDPGLYEGDCVLVKDATFLIPRVNGVKVESSRPRFSFEGLVIRRYGMIEVGVNDAFVLFINLEIADKEQIPAITDILKNFSPECVDYNPDANQAESS